MYALFCIFCLIFHPLFYAMDGDSPKPIRYFPHASKHPKHKEEQIICTAHTRPLSGSFPPTNIPDHPTSDPLAFEKIHHSKPGQNRPTKTLAAFPPKDKLKKEESPKKISRSTFSLSFVKHSSSPEPPHHLPKKSSHKSQKTSPHSNSLRKNYSIIQAVLKGNTEKIQLFLSDPTNNPNQQTIGPLNTLLHLSVETRRRQITELLLCDFRVNTLIKNKEQKAPFQLIEGKDKTDYEVLYKALIVRSNLDHAINAIIFTDPTILENNDETLKKKLSDIKPNIDNALPDYATIQFMLGMIHSKISYDIATFKMIIAEQKKNPNAQDLWGNTLLHYAVYLRNEKLLFTLLKNPAVNSLIENCENSVAHQLISTMDKQYGELRLPLFARSSLDKWLNAQVDMYLFTYPNKLTISKNDEIFKEITKAIQEKSTEIKNAQVGKNAEDNDRALPKETIYPTYADEQFLFVMFYARINQKRAKQNIFQPFTQDQSAYELVHSYVQDTTPTNESNTDRFTRIKKPGVSREELLSDLAQIDSDSVIDVRTTQ